MPQVRRRHPDLHPDPVALPWSGSSPPGQFMMPARRNSLRPNSAIPAGHTTRLSSVLPQQIQHRQPSRSEEHTSELQSLRHLVCRLLLEKNENRFGRRVPICETPPHAIPSAGQLQWVLYSHLCHWRVYRSPFYYVGGTFYFVFF